MRRALLRVWMGTALTILLPAWLMAIPTLETSRVDFLNSYPATNRREFPDPFPAIEYDSDRDFVVPAVVYRRGSTVQLQISLRNNGPEESLGTFTFRDPVFRSEGLEWPLTPAIQSHGVSIAPDGGTQSFFISLDGIPDIVAKGEIRISYEVAATQGAGLPLTGLVWTTYLVREQPVSPMSVPWTEVLDWTCSWAWGASDELVVARKLTWGGWSSFEAFYHPSEFPTFTIAVSGNTPFKLSEFLNHAGERQIGCRDFAHWTVVCFASQGYSARTLRLSPLVPISPPFEPPHPTTFRTNALASAGYPFSSEIFNFRYHQVLQLVNSGTVFDASAAQYFDIVGLTYEQVVPVDWPINMSGSDYWQYFYMGPKGLVNGWTGLPPGAVPLVRRTESTLGVL